MDLTRSQFFINGEWVAPYQSDTIEVINPTTEAVFGTIPAGTAVDIDRAVAAANGAFPGWSQRTMTERADWCRRIGEALYAKQDDIALLIAQEVGTPLKIAKSIQARLPIATFASMPRLSANIMLEEQQGNSLIVRVPMGVVGCITPWNYPLHQIAAKVAPALAAGCTVILKPSEVAPFNAFLLADIMREVGLPPGVFNLVTGYGPITGEALVDHPLVTMLSFTGSLRAGQRVGEIAAKSIKRVTLELGGKSPNVILDDADLRQAVTAGVNNCMLNSGQTCTALTRMLVPRAQLAAAEQFAVEAASRLTVGDPLAPETRLGPLVSGSQRDRVRGYIEMGTAEGAKLLTGGAAPPMDLSRGYFVSPTIFSEVRTTMTIAQEEIFGPVLAILPYDDEAESITIANDTRYGLAAGVWSGDPERARRVARRLRAGQVEINGGAFNPLAPFGGFKQSGHGRELGSYGLDEFFEIQSLQLPA